MAWALKHESDKCRVQVDAEGHLRSLDDQSKDVSWFNLFKVGCGARFFEWDSKKKGDIERIITNLRKTSSSGGSSGSQTRTPFRSLYLMNCPSDPVRLFKRNNPQSIPAENTRMVNSQKRRRTTGRGTQQQDWTCLLDDDTDDD